MVTFTYSSMNTGDMFFDPDVFVVLIEINGKVQTTQVRRRLLAARLEFESIVSQFIINNTNPCRVRFTQTKEIWCDIDNEFKHIDVYVEFRNLAYDDKIRNQAAV